MKIKVKIYDIEPIQELEKYLEENRIWTSYTIPSHHINPFTKQQATLEIEFINIESYNLNQFLETIKILIKIGTLH